MVQNPYDELYNVSTARAASAFSPLIRVSLLLGVFGGILVPLTWILLFTHTKVLDYFFAWSTSGGEPGVELVFRQVVFFGLLPLIIPLGAAITGYLGYQRLPFEVRHWPAWLGGSLGVLFTLLSVVCLLGVLFVLMLSGLFDFY
jgi:hypothetical protein